MPSKYTSQTKKAQEFLDELFAETKGQDIDRNQLYLAALRKHGLSKKTLDDTMELFAQAGEIEVTSETITVKKK